MYLCFQRFVSVSYIVRTDRKKVGRPDVEASREVGQHHPAITSSLPASHQRLPGLQRSPEILRSRLPRCAGLRRLLTTFVSVFSGIKYLLECSSLLTFSLQSMLMLSLSLSDLYKLYQNILTEAVFYLSIFSLYQFIEGEIKTGNETLLQLESLQIEAILKRQVT